MLPMLRLNGGHRSRNKKKSLKPHIPTVDPLPNRPEKIIILSNEAFSDYYSQQLALDSDQFQLFMASLKMPLPVSFRFTGSRDYADDLKDFMVKHIFPKVAVSVDGLLIKPPQMIDWYPNGLCYQFDCSRQILRRSVEAKQFQSFLVHETQVGNISRQELVSMIPVLLLDVMPGHAVFDSCASPGSKTAQIIEALTPSGNGIPEGLVIANDSSQPRCYTLVHQAKRLQSPCLMVTNHDAQIFPRIPIISQSGAKKSILQFDRVLCDVPCSGDGTLRKNVGIWKNFAVGNGNALHRIQKQILKRGVELCKVGGRIVYSTCTFNPIENEAVVASILKESNGALKLLNVSDSLPTLLRKPGLTTWKVSNKNGKMFDEQPNKDCFIDSMFPPENIGDLGMEKCIRIYPHLQNTGGFFVAVIEKVGAFGSIDRVNSFYEKNNDDNIEEGLVDDDEVSELSEMVVDVNDQDESQQVSKKVKVENYDESYVTVPTKKFHGYKEDPFIIIPDDHEAIKSCREMYGLSTKFPQGLFVVRSDPSQKIDVSNIYVVSEKVKQVLGCEKIKIINCGVKVFKRQGGESFESCPYRVCSEGVPTIAPYLPVERQITIGFDDLCLLIKEGYPKFSILSDDAQKQMIALKLGSCLLRYDPNAIDSKSTRKDNIFAQSLKTLLILPFFRAHVSASLLLDKAERKSLYYRLTGEGIDEFSGVEKENQV